MFTAGIQFHTWRDTRRRVPFFSGADGADALQSAHGVKRGVLKFSTSPTKNVQFSMEWPVFWRAYQPSPNRILQHIFPFLIVIFFSPQLRIPEIALPNWMLNRTRPFLRSQILPVTHPLLQWLVRKYTGSAEKVNMIRHDHIPADRPRFGLAPGIQNCFSRIIARKDAFSILAAHRRKYNDWFIMTLNRRHARRVLTAGI
jgi:hypothetical protein